MTSSRRTWGRSTPISPRHRCRRRGAKEGNYAELPSLPRLRGVATTCSRCGRDCRDVRQYQAAEAAARFEAGLAVLSEREKMRSGEPGWARLARAFGCNPDD